MDEFIAGACYGLLLVEDREGDFCFRIHIPEEGLKQPYGKRAIHFTGFGLP